MFLLTRKHSTELKYRYNTTEMSLDILDYRISNTLLEKLQSIASIFRVDNQDESFTVISILMRQRYHQLFKSRENLENGCTQNYIYYRGRVISLYIIQLSSTIILYIC